MGFFYNPCRGLLIFTYTAVIISHLSPSMLAFLDILLLPTFSFSIFAVNGIRGIAHF